MSALEVTDLFVLSDVLQMELFLSKRGEITGELQKAAHVPDIGLKMNMKVKIMDNKTSWRTENGKLYPVLAVMLHVQGDLHLLVVNDRKADEVRVLILDKAREKVAGDIRYAIPENEKKTVSGVVSWLQTRGLVVAEFVRNEYGTEWKQAA